MEIQLVRAYVGLGGKNEIVEKPAKEARLLIKQGHAIEVEAPELVEDDGDEQGESGEDDKPLTAAQKRAAAAKAAKDK